MGLALFSPLAFTGVIYFIVHNIFAKANLFLISGAVNQLEGSYQLKKLGGLYRSRLGLALLFLIPALSLAGLPPLSGFWGKLILVQAGLELKQYLIVAISLGVSMLTLYSMIKIWNEAFWKAAPKDTAVTSPAKVSRQKWFFHLTPIIGLAVFTILIGLFVEPFFQLAQQAAAQLLDPSQYIQTVLGGKS
jgi:multicomponent Na+:H+ antiporter subunit D